jgi:outer membrane protein assembly factor BamD
MPGCLFRRHRSKDLATPVNPGDQPDKILYEKASNEIRHGRYDVGRLTLQTLINTYPDSEYLAKAKLAIADSYYQEGGVSGLTQSEAEYKDFITFFPTAPEAPEAQYRVGMAHFRLMGKYDRDHAEAVAAETEFKAFLAKYPDSPFMPRVKARLREVQEVLGEADFTIAKFYYTKGAMPAAIGRFRDIADQYPNFSRADEALWYLGQALERQKKSREAIPYYARLITQFPLSERTHDAKARLTAMHQPIPRPTRAMVARAEADAAHRKQHEGMFAKLGGTMSSSPDLSATRQGPVKLGAKPTETQTARNAPPVPVGNTVAVQPVSDQALKSGKPADSGSTASKTTSTGTASTTTTSTITASSQAGGGDPQPDPPNPDNPPNTSKKKGHFHILKKLYPF